MDDVHRPASARAYGAVDRTVGLQIEQALKLRDMSLSQLADDAHIPVDVLHACCAGQKRLAASSLCDIARVLRLPVSYFFTPLMRKEH
jgi:Cro/C1-type HTH DNA-binding domain